MIYYLKNCQATKTVSELDNSFIMVTNDVEIKDILDYINYPKCDYKYVDVLFVKEHNGEYTQIYGLTGSIPYLDHFVTLIYINNEYIKDQLVETY